MPKLPTLPGVAVKILEAVKSDELSLQELGGIISTDPVLSSEVLKLINSSFFSIPRKVTSVNHAVNLLGLNAVKNLALSFSLVKDFKNAANSRFDYDTFWKGSIIAAITSKYLAKRIRPSFAEDAFFLGLLHNIGMLALNQGIPDQYDLVARERETNSGSWHEAENKVLGFDHAGFGHYLVRSWDMPESFSVPIRFHHAPEELDVHDDELVVPTRILSLASLFMDFFCGSGETLLLGLIESNVQRFGFAETLDINEMTRTIQDQAEEVLPLFEFRITEEINYLQMIEEARKELINLSSDFLNDLLEQRKQIEELSKKATRDGLTGLVNHLFFNEVLDKEIQRCCRYSFPLSLVMGDIDHFKTVNDSKGHLAGDSVLQSVAHCLKNCLRESDSIARYGGEEFAIILPETNLSNARVAAERMRKTVQALQPEFQNTTVPVTMSFGIASWSDQDDAVKNDLIQKADQALYRAKQSGRNKCCT